MTLAADKLKDLISIITRLLPQSSTVPPSLAADEVGVELDTGKLKIGDGSTPWASLPYLTTGGSGATGATGPTGPAGGGGALATIVPLSSSDINSLSGSPVVAVTGQGSGKVIVPQFYIIQYKFNTTPFDNDVTISLSAGSVGFTGGIDTGTNGSVDTIGSAVLVNSTASDISGANGQPLFITGDQDNTSGDGSMIVTIVYNVVDFN